MLTIGGVCDVIGNLYSIENPYDHQARMFFAQGCEVDPQDDE